MGEPGEVGHLREQRFYVDLGPRLRHAVGSQRRGQEQTELSLHSGGKDTWDRSIRRKLSMELLSGKT